MHKNARKINQGARAIDSECAGGFSIYDDIAIDCDVATSHVWGSLRKNIYVRHHVAAGGVSIVPENRVNSIGRVSV